MNWYFTFMFKQPKLKNRYVKVPGSYSDARSTLYDIIGEKFAFQYCEEDFLPLIDYYHLTEISLDELEKNPQWLNYDE
jgi:hypothetical protein